MFKNVNILEFGDDIQIHHGKCIKISTNMPSGGLEIPKIACEIAKFLTLCISQWFYYPRDRREQTTH